MKAKELMIGDFCKYVGQTLQVEELYNDGYVLCNKKNGEYIKLPVEAVKSIELTEELLKINGCRAYEDDSGLVLYQIREQLYYDLNTHQLCFSDICEVIKKREELEASHIETTLVAAYIAQNINMDVSDCVSYSCEEHRTYICECKWVHTLQHALRLFSLDELADDFKIQ